MALDFPSSPSVGQTYPNPAIAGVPVYAWDGEKWGAGGAGAFDAPSDGSAYGRLNNAWAKVLPIAGGTLTGPVNAPTPAIADNSTKLATTGFVNQDKLIPNGTDLNTIVAPGTYACNDNTSTNGPVAGGQWYLHVQTYGGAPAYVMQRAIDLTAVPSGMYVRTRVNGTWEPWAKVGSPPVGHMPGDLTGGAAAAGEVGEVLSASAPSVGIPNGASFNIASIPLTPGDWDVSAIGLLNLSPLTIQTFEISISQTSATLDNTVGHLATFVSGAFVSYYGMSLAVPPFQIRVAVNTTIYLVGYVTYNGGNGGTAAGFLRARRMR
jgi:hypothetical protein